jgi:RNA polymerase sigma factor (sigma-70 family)
MVEPAFDRRERIPEAAGEVQGDDLDAQSDEELLRRYRDDRGGDVFTAMVRRHQPMVLRTCQRLVRNLHDAEDAAQSVFLVLAERPEVVRSSLVGCLHGLARAAVSELCRSRRRRTEREELAARINSMFARLRGRGQPMENQELGEELDVALGQLPDRLKQAVILRYLEGHSQEEAARRAGCTIATLGWRSMKGLQRLRTILGRRGVALSTAGLLTALAAEARAAAALATAGAASAPATAAAASVAAILVKRSLLGLALRRAAIVLLLLGAGVGLGVGLALQPPAAPNSPPNPAAPVAARGAEAKALGLFEDHRDIGGPAHDGEAKLEGGAYTVRGGGADIYKEADQFHFVYRKSDDDGEIIARVSSESEQEGRQVFAGVMFRETLDADSHHVAVLLSADGKWHVTHRDKDHPASSCDNDPTEGGNRWVRLTRRGNAFTAYTRPAETEKWKQVGELELPMNSSLYVGLAVTAHDNEKLAETTFDCVSVQSRPRR